jgi:hypothetical protein
MRTLIWLLILAVLTSQMDTPVLAAQKTEPRQPEESPVLEQAPASDRISSKTPGNQKRLPAPIDHHSRKEFEEGYQLFLKKQYRKAAPYFYGFVANRTSEGADYDWAQFFLGISLKQLGLLHAAVDVLSDLTMRRPDPQIVTFCLEFFEEIMRRRPFDRDLLINQVLCNQDDEGAEGSLADFVNYYQGLCAWQQGFREWAEDRYKRIGPDTPYYNRYLYEMSLVKVSEDRLPDAIAILRRILNDPDETNELLDEVRKTLARLLYEIGQYREADRLYGQIQENILQQSHNLMERAWAHYRMGNPESAMGLLCAFEAPGFQKAVTPELFILKAFIYKDVCHYQSALDMVSEFKVRYREALMHIYQRDPATTNKTLMAAVLSKQKVEEIYRFMELLESEKKDCAQFDKDPQLLAYLNKIYELQMQESQAELRALVEKEYEKMANQLLEYEEKARLMEYEIDLDMHQKVHRQQDKKDSTEQKSKDKGTAVYPFQGEIWNDELADYKVALPNRCENRNH